MTTSKVWLALLAPAFFLLCAGRQRHPHPAWACCRFSGPLTIPTRRRKRNSARLLYFDKRLSADGTVSCANCHHPKFAFYRRQRRVDRDQGPEGRTKRSHGVQPRLQPGPVLGWTSGNSRRPGEGPDGESHRDGQHSRRNGGSKLRGIPGYGPLFKKAFGTDEMDIDTCRKGDRDVRAHGAFRQLALRPIQGRKEKGDDCRSRFAACSFSSTRRDATHATKA